MKSYKDLQIFQLSKALAIRIHHLSLRLPKHELYEEGSQVRRSSKAITALIVEGYGRRRYKNDYIKYLVYSHAECDETIVHIEFILETNSAAELGDLSEVKTEYESLSRMINKFIQWVEDNL